MEPDPEKIAAAVAAMNAEWKMLEPQIYAADDPEWEEEERREALKMRARLLREFLERHQAVMHAPGSAVAHLDLEALKKKEAAWLATDAAVKKLEEELLHRAADQAEADADLVEATLEVLAGLEARSEEEWAELDFETREKHREALENLREVREGMLGELTAERRRYWEERCPEG